MMGADWLLPRMREWTGREAIIWNNTAYTYGWLLDNVGFWQKEFAQHDLAPGQVVAVVGDYCPRVCALLLTLIQNKAIVVPLTSTVQDKHAQFMDIAQVEAVFTFGNDDSWTVTRRYCRVTHSLIRSLLQEGQPGLVLFSSGSTGESKAALHNLAKLLEKFKVRRHALRTLTFLLLDHIGGINTLFYIISNGGTVVSLQNRSPEAVCRAIERHRAELLPTSPTFLNLLLISEAYKHYDLSSLKLITYGTEVMPEQTLKRLNQVFPGVEMKQTYGLSELGILRSKSRKSSSLWVKIGGEGVETKVIDNTLWIRTPSAMLGYLNAPSPFDDGGWFNTEDRVEVDGEFVRFLGRDSDIINVGGEKLYPAEVESVLMEMDNIADACVYGEKHPITGEIVVAEVELREPEPLSQLRQRIRLYCKGRLARYKIPVKVKFPSESRAGARFKKMRPPSPARMDKNL